MTGIEEVPGLAESRQRYAVGAVKIPYAERDVVHDVLADGDRGWRDVLGADTPDDDEKWPVGSTVAYSLELTEEEAARFAAASNARYVEVDRRGQPDRALRRPAGAPAVPTASTLTWMRMLYTDLGRWHGRDVTVAVCDSGTTQVVRNQMGWTLVGRHVTGGVTFASGAEIGSPVDSHSHGCLVAPNAVPYGGRILDIVIVENDGSAFGTSMAAGITYAVDNGARVVNMSYSFTGDSSAPPQVFLDAFAYARDNGAVQVVLSAGNDNRADLNTPSTGCRTFVNVHASIAFDEATDRRGLFSNHHADGSGSAPGVSVASYNTAGQSVTWDGTSASAPHMAQTIARGATGGTYTSSQVAAALRSTARNTGAGASEQGRGAWDLQAALASLGAFSALPSAPGLATPTHIETAGAAGNNASYNLGTPTGVAADDVRIVFLVSSVAAGITVPNGWALLTDTGYSGTHETNAGQTVGPSRVRVLAKPYAAGDPAPTTLAFGAGLTFFSAIGAITLRVPGGFNPEQFVPLTRFGTSASVETLPVLPNTTNDLLVCMFAQRHPTSPTGTLTTPTGLTSRGLFRPASGATTGYIMRVATAPLTSGNRTASYISTSNSSTATWCSAALSAPAGVEIAPVVQTEPGGPPGGVLSILPRS